MEKIKKKDVIKVTVTGVQKYGAFVNTKDEDYDGLIHISEISYGYVKNVNDYLKVGDTVYAEVVDVNNDEKELKLSIKDIDTLRKTYEGDKNYMACIRRVDSSRTDPDFVGYYDLEEAHKQDLSDSYETGYDDGMNKGKVEEKIEIAKVMLQDTNDYRFIAKYTGLSIEEIKSL